MNGSRNARTVMISVLRIPVGYLVGVTLIWSVMGLSPAIAQAPKDRHSLHQVQQRHRERFREFSNQIEKLAEKCDEKGFVKDAAQIRARMFVPDSQSLRVEKLPTEVRPPIPANVTGDERASQIQLRHLETDYAKDLCLQARLAASQGFPSYAYDLVREAAMHDSDNQQVRRILGFERQKNEWMTPFASSQIRQGKVWHEEFGWLPLSYRQRYIDGERHFNDRWVTAEKERELRRDFKSAWEIRTDHYLIKTNVSLERGVEMGKALEDFYEVFNETFAGFFLTPGQLKKLFDGTLKNGRPDSKPYTVHFYRTREEYLERMRKFFPNIDQTNGVYLTSDRVSHFYHDPKHDHEGTLFHEATHQLFFESDSANRTICENHHFWIIEGIACYMESFQRKNGAFTLGDPKHIRFDRARYNLLHEKYYVSLRDFSEFGMQGFQGSHELVKNYTQAAGLSRFFMHYDKGRYREALVNHLVQLYSSDKRIRDQAQGLDELTGVDFAELDREYAEDAREIEVQLAAPAQ